MYGVFCVWYNSTLLLAIACEPSHSCSNSAHCFLPLVLYCSCGESRNGDDSLFKSSTLSSFIAAADDDAGWYGGDIQLLLLQQPPYLRDQVVGITPAASPMREAGYVVLSESCGAVPRCPLLVLLSQEGAL